MPVAGAIFLALLIGGYVVAAGPGLPTVEQVTNPEGSVISATDSQLGLLALIVIGVLFGMIVMGAGMAGLVWFLSQGVTTVGHQSDNPFNFSLRPEGNSIGTLIQQNSMKIIVTLGALLIIAFILVALLTLT